MARYSRGGCHRRTDEVRASTLALTPFKIAVGGGCAAFAGAKAVVVHPQAHRAARLAPFEAGVAKHLVEAFLLGLRLYEPRARHDHRLADVGSQAPAFDDGGGDAQVLDARIG